MNKTILINLSVWFLLAVYLTLGNLGFLGASFVYQQNTYSPWRSHFWPRANYEIASDQQFVFKQSTWLDINLPVMFQRAQVEIHGEGFENLELIWKEKVDGDVLLISHVPASGRVELDFSGISEPHYLVFSLSEDREFSLEKLRISFSQPRWLYDFKKNVIK